MAIEAVLFDMGNTLIDFESRPGSTLQREAAVAVREHLCRQVDGKIPENDEFLARFDDAWRRVEELHRPRTGQPTVAEAVETVLSGIGISMEPGDMTELERTHYETIRVQIRPYPEATEVLAALRDRGLKLALISNTIWPTDLHREDLERFGMSSFFQCVIFSRDFGRMKPHPSIFQEALQAIAVAPENAMVVGDRLEADVRGARNVGCRAVLKIHPFTYPASFPDGRPDAEIENLYQLLTLLDREKDTGSVLDS
jgi:putative hydrolase of the HAD superfamily